MLKDINTYINREDKPIGSFIERYFYNADKKINNNNINDDMHIIDDNDKRKNYFYNVSNKILDNNKN
jgi:hypothetical protein